MPNQDLIRELKTFLNNHFQIPNGMLDQFLHREIKEIEVGQYCAPMINQINQDLVGFMRDFDAALARAAITVNGNAYDFNQAGLTGPVARTAPEDFNAIKAYSTTQGFDPVKALTNIFRAIKAAGR